MTDSNALTFDIAIVTRNRAEALEMSIPLMLTQARQPRNFIVIDSSDDHAPVKELVERLTKDWGGNVEVHHSEPGIPVQRNVALKYVNSDIVFFPDDDSLWHQDVVESIMQAYEADVEGVLGAVGGRPVTDSPLVDDQLAYKKSKKSIFKYKIQPLRNKIEEALFPKPFNVYAEEQQAMMGGLSLPWLEEKDVVIVPNISGFRMTFRVELLRKFGFDELMASRVKYAPHEDMEVSVQVLKSGHLVAAARGARIFHHKHPDPRAPAYSYGFSQIVNYTYIVRKHMSNKSKAWKATRPFLFYKVMMYRIGMNKNVFKGGMDAWNASRALFECKSEDLEATYLSLFDKYLPS